MYKDIPIFLGHCIVGFLLCYVLITVYELAYVFAANSQLHSSHDYFAVFNGWIHDPTVNVKISLNPLIPLLETLIFQVLLIRVLQKATHNPNIVTAFVFALFVQLHAFIYPLSDAFGAGIACLVLTHLYIKNQERTGPALSAIATAISYIFLSILLVNL